MFLTDGARNLYQIEPLCAVICKSKGAMTDHPSTQSQPSMEDILASIRRIIDDEEQAPDSARAPASPVPDVDARSGATVVTPDWAKGGSAVPDDATSAADPEAETIFPQRQGRLWRRVAGHDLDDDEPDPLFDDDTLERTEVLDDDTLELDNLLDADTANDPEENRRVLDAAAGHAPTAPETSDSGMTAGVAAAGMAAITGIGATTASTMDRVTGKFTENEEKRERTTPVEPSYTAEADALDDDLPPPVFERVDVAPADDLIPDQNERDSALDDVMAVADQAGLGADYSTSLDPEIDDHERELDDRFYAADTLDEQPPEIDGSYADSLGGEPVTRRNEGAPNEDEMETVGGLVRDALRGRLPAVPSKPEAGALVSGGAEDSAARSLAALARYDANAPRRIYGGIKITDDDDSPTIEGMVQDTLRPMLRDWLNDNLPTLVENMVKQEVDRISARSRRFVRDDE